MKVNPIEPSQRTLEILKDVSAVIKQHEVKEPEFYLDVLNALALGTAIHLDKFARRQTDGKASCVRRANETRPGMYPIHKGFWRSPWRRKLTSGAERATRPVVLSTESGAFGTLTSSRLSQNQQPMKKFSPLFWVVLTTPIAFTSCQKPPPARIAGPPEVLVTAVIQKEVPVIREFVGTLNGLENAQVRAREVGYLQSIAYQQGGYVKKGDLLFEIDPRPFRAALDQAKGQLQEAQATLLGVELDAKRAKELFQHQVISEQQYTNETQAYETKLAAAAAAQAAVDNAQLNLGFTKITSPLDGIAGEQQAQIGDLVGTGANQVLTTVSQIDPILFYLPISEQTYWQYADALKKAMMRPEAERPAKVELILANGSVYPHKGKFAFVGRYVDEKTGTIQIAVSFPNPELTLRPGQYGRARAEIDTIPDALLIPQQAVSQLQGNDQVAVVHPDGKAEIRAVKVGQLYGRNMIVVTQGLKAGEQVIVEGFQRVRQGMPVSAKPYTDASTTQEAQNDSDKNSSGQTKAATAGQKPGESGG